MLPRDGHRMWICGTAIPGNLQVPCLHSVFLGLRGLFCDRLCVTCLCKIGVSIGVTWVFLSLTKTLNSVLPHNTGDWTQALLPAGQAPTFKQHPACFSFFVCFVFLRWVSLHSLGCPGTHCLDQAGLDSQVLGIEVPPPPLSSLVLV